MKFRLFTPTCHHCNKRIQDASDIFCLECMGKLPKSSFKLEDQNNAIKSRFNGLLDIDRAGSFLIYLQNELVENILVEIKYNSNKNLAKELGVLTAQDWSKEVKSRFDMIIPLPLHDSKIAQRGYNQSEVYAQGLSQESGIPICNRDFIRTKATSTQTRLNKKERIQNVFNAFEVTNLSTFKNKRILLIDDVITTGSTLESAARALIKSHVKSISIFTLASASEL